ncbi:glycosyltransferase family 2 protein [Rhodospirillaceae bacterium SYSU D60014]|uniref:glycosyltransferase family 2 protein n=1 Tax=Virgifigura deserti TaxID=2268457 RepID=UPI000E66D39E
MGAHQERVVIIILNLNKKSDLLACLESVSMWDNRNNAIVVVDNGSTDGSADAVAERFPNVHLVRNRENLGASAGRNAGIRYAKETLPFDHVLFLDNDTLVHRDFLSRLLAAFAEDRQAGLACGKAYTEFPSNVIMSAGIKVDLYTGIICDIGSGELDRGQFDIRRYVDACGAFGFLIRREALAQVGGFWEALDPYGWEEVDLCLRARGFGYRCLYAPDAIVHHKGAKIGRGPVPLYERYKVKNYLLLLRRHTTPWQKITCAICFPVRACVIIGRLIHGGNAGIVLAQLRGFYEGLLWRRRGGIKAEGGSINE